MVKLFFCISLIALPALATFSFPVCEKKSQNAEKCESTGVAKQTGEIMAPFNKILESSSISKEKFIFLIYQRVHNALEHNLENITAAIKCYDGSNRPECLETEDYVQELFKLRPVMRQEFALAFSDDSKLAAEYPEANDEQRINTSMLPRPSVVGAKMERLSPAEIKEALKSFDDEQNEIERIAAERLKEIDQRLIAAGQKPRGEPERSRTRGALINELRSDQRQIHREAYLQILDAAPIFAYTGIPQPEKGALKQAFEAMYKDVHAKSVKIDEAFQVVRRDPDNVKALSTLMANPLVDKIVAEHPEYCELAQTFADKINFDELKKSILYASFGVAVGVATGGFGVAVGGAMGTAIAVGGGALGGSPFLYDNWLDYKSKKNAFAHFRGESLGSAAEAADAQDKLLKSVILQAAFSGTEAIAARSIMSLAKNSRLSVNVAEILKEHGAGRMLIALHNRLQDDEMIALLQELSRLPARARDGLLQKVSKMSAQQLKGFIAKLPKRINEWRKRYVSEVKDSPFYSRLLIKSRDQNQSRNPLHNPSGYLFNPIATAFNRPREVTLPVSTLGYSLLVDRQVENLKNNMHEKLIKQAIEQQEEIPGGEFAIALAEAGAVDPLTAARATLKHQQDFVQWYKSTDKSLPRVADLKKTGVIQDEEVQRLDHLAREVFEQTRKKARGDVKEFVATLPDNMREALDKDEHFRGKTNMEREFLSSVYWPAIKIGSRSDIELSQALLASIESSKPKSAGQIDSILYNIYSSLDRGEISLTTAYALADRALTEPEKVESKMSKATSILPPQKMHLANRPDIPQYSEPITLKTVSGRKHVELNSELDRWHLLQQDPRFAEIHNAWQSARISDVAALKHLSDSMEGINDLLEKKRRSPVVDVATAKELHGLVRGRGANIFFLDVTPTIEKAVKDRKLSPEQADNCFRQSAQLWMDFHWQRAKWIEEGKSYAEFGTLKTQHSEEIKAKFSQIVANCGR